MANWAADTDIIIHRTHEKNTSSTVHRPYWSTDIHFSADQPEGLRPESIQPFCNHHRSK